MKPTVVMPVIDIVTEAFTEADCDPENAIALARRWIVIGGRDGLSEDEFKRLVVDIIWDMYGMLVLRDGKPVWRNGMLVLRDGKPVWRNGKVLVKD
jgi:hypothetical protein